MRHISRRSATLIFWLTAPLPLPLIVFARPLLSLFGPEFTTGAACLTVLCLGLFVNAAFGPGGYILSMTGHQDKIRNAMLVGAVANIVLNLVLIPRYGILGAAWASTSSTILWNVLTSVFVWRAYGFWCGYRPFWLKAALGGKTE